MADALTDFLTGNDLAVVGSLDATLDSGSNGFVNFDLGFAGDKEIGLGFSHAFTIADFPIWRKGCGYNQTSTSKRS